MIFGRLRSPNVLSVLLAILLTGALTLAEPLGKGSKSSKKSARAAKSSAKSARSRKASGAKKVARKKSGRVSKSSKLASRKSKRPGRNSRRALTARGRKGRAKWRGQAARTAPSYHRSGIHNFLTESWVYSTSDQARATAAAAPASAQSNDQSSEGAQLLPPAGLATQPQAQPATDAQPGAQPDAAAAEGVILNPLVQAYATSLASFGYEADNQGFIVETLSGEVLAEHNADRPFNPASVVKVATSLVAISKLGPDFKFRTSLYTDGLLDPATGTLNGSLYLMGSGDPAFFYENALLIADQLNRNGIRTVSGNLIILGPFYFNLSASREASARSFRNALTPETWNAGVKSAYPRFLAMRPAASKVATQGQYAVTVASGPPSLKIMGETITDTYFDTSNLKLLAVHTSLPLVRVLKGLNDFSNNWMASVIGNLVGGPDAVQKFLKEEIGLKEDEMNIVTASGLGSNYISPRGTIHIVRKLITYLDKNGLGLEDILPVAGIDKGTLERRFTDAYRGAVVGKTGTLSGVSALAGVAYTRSRGPLLFVIYNRGGSVARFRAAQDETVKKLITFFGGPAPVPYSPTSGAQVSQQRSPASTPAEADSKN